MLVNLFETAVTQTMGYPSQLCVTAEFCGKALAIEHDGSVFSCDHFVYPEYRLGDIKQRPLTHMTLSTRQEAFGMSKRDSLPDYCLKCPYLTLCRGECPKNRLVRAQDGEIGLNYLCPGIKRFFDYAVPILAGIAQMLKEHDQGR
ncbi:SPASM domain-containing protein [Aeromonas enteropelogenes]|uniref:SPASM domain-containing protein n=1 Tax=Aeromonas enteropelogenes TaxID=29489 RepID=UPI003BA24E1E